MPEEDAKCCVPTAEEEALLAAGDYTPEELWGGPRPTCPKCIGSAPVPVAGPAPTVHRYRVVKMLSEDGNKIDYKPHGPWVVMAEVHDTHVSRLLAENAALQQRLNIADQQVGDLQSELTRAREALEGMVEYFPEGHSDGECFSVERAKAVIAHQSAPAACWTPANHECPGDGVGACKKCPNSHAANCSDEIERLAKAVYAGCFSSEPAFVPWVDGGNSIMQDKARDQARRTIEAARSAKASAKGGSHE